MYIKLLVALVLLVPACGAAAETDSGTATQPLGTSTPAEAAAGPGKLDGLTITLQLGASSVQSGGEVTSTLTVKNDSGKTVVDPACLITAGRYALVPVDDPDAELWLQPVVDCGGPFKMRDGFIERYSGRVFPARTKFGDALPAGDYIATLEIDEYSQRLEVPVRVTD